MNEGDLTIDGPKWEQDLPVPARSTPSHIGRYRIEKVLGEGGFGLVYLAYDDQLQRLVAIKVPHRERISKPEDAEAYLAEARIVASLDHPHIVPVHDVGRSDDGLCFIVSKFIDGTDLATRLQESRLSTQETVELVATVAEALHYAHKRGLVHRDVKPGNILIDKSGMAYVADFGLALKEEDYGKGGGVCGTPAYMSPEQANGEGHRVDGRSDIFSLGVVFYELLTGRRPFRGDMIEVLIQIVADEPKPPRQIDDLIPKELDRICLKALSKRASERYSTAMDMAEDLRHFLAQQTPAGNVGKGVGSPSIMPVPQQPSTSIASRRSGAVSATTPTPSSDRQAPKIVPKGLRSFDAHDADFFLDLLPGPRDRDGLPDSIRFWKSRIEEKDADNTFTVGLIYGPSGCGKSSLVKAGLLPRLSDQVIAVYVEATAEETEERLLHGLRKRCPALPDNLGLKETLVVLRRGQDIPVGKKVLIVLDQFEQWLHSKKEEQNTELVQALRQCDGGRVQCVVMVRDDFWMAATRFMRELEIRLLEGQNSAPVDLFDMDHARKVLAAFGRALGKLPESSGETTKEQKAFLKQAVSDLAQEGKVISVRLALFAEMMKGKAWTPDTLKEVGGTEGVGVTFLEETFSANTAPPEHRYHQKAARSILKAMLPESGTDIKGHMRSYGELQNASGHGNRLKDFDDLIRILDSEIRLITPTDPDGKEGADESTYQAQPGQKYYQLTHDYLVPALRDWLTRKQKETRRGRVELLLADRAAVWNARPENRQLPSLLQWLQICWLTAKKNWTPAQRKMMAKASRYHVVRAALVGVLIALIGLGSWEGIGRSEARRYRDRLMDATTAEVPGIVKDMAPYRHWVDPLLQDAYAQAANDKNERKQLHASLALLPVDTGQVEYLYKRLLGGEPQEVVVIRQELLDHKADLTERLWTLLENPKKDQAERFRAACALATFAPDDPRWENVSKDVAGTLVIQEPFVIDQWTDALKDVKRWLIPPLADFLMDEKRSITERRLIVRAYGSYAADTPDAYARLEKQLDEKIASDASVEAKIALAKKQANIGTALLVMDKGEKVWPLLKHSPDPTLRSYLIEQLGPGGVDAKLLTTRLDNEKEVSARRAILLCLGGFAVDRLSLRERRNQLPGLLHLYGDDVDPGIHGAAEWLLRRWEASDELKAIEKGLATRKVEGKRDWYINGQGQTMMVVPKAGEFWMGERDKESEAAEVWTGGVTSRRHRVQIGRSFAIASKLVTVEEFLRSRIIHRQLEQFAPSSDCPVNTVIWYDAAAYCNWLSEQEGIRKEEWCYVPNTEAVVLDVVSAVGQAGSLPTPWPVGWKAAAMQKAQYGEYDKLNMAPNYLHRTGYRLPTEAEWEYACRAGAETAYSFGEPDDLLAKYAWFSTNSLGKSHPVGSLKPNDLGLFDMHGNASDWCQDVFKSYVKGGDGKATEDIEDNAYINSNSSRVLRGGAFNDEWPLLRSASRFGCVPTSGSFFLGFRLARTLPLGSEEGKK